MFQLLVEGFERVGLVELRIHQVLGVGVVLGKHEDDLRGHAPLHGHGVHLCNLRRFEQGGVLQPHRGNAARQPGLLVGKEVDHQLQSRIAHGVHRHLRAVGNRPFVSLLQRCAAEQRHAKQAARVFVGAAAPGGFAGDGAIGKQLDACDFDAAALLRRLQAGQQIALARLPREVQRRLLFKARLRRVAVDIQVVERLGESHHVSHRHNAALAEALRGARQAAYGLRVIEHGLGALHHAVGGQLGEHAVGRAVCVAAKVAANGIGRVFANAGNLQSAGVADTGVAIRTAHVDRLRGGNQIQIVARGRAAFFEFGFVVAPAFDPVVRTEAGLGVVFERSDQAGNVFHQGHGARHGIDDLRQKGGVRVHVDKAGQHGLALQIDPLVGNGLLRIAGVADPADFSVLHGEGGDKFGFAAAGEDFGVGEQTGRHKRGQKAEKTDKAERLPLSANPPRSGPSF